MLTTMGIRQALLVTVVVSLLTVSSTAALKLQSRMRLSHFVHSPEYAKLGFGDRLSTLASMDEQRWKHHPKTITYGGGLYTVRASVGTPPREQAFFVDTGSDMCWFQCSNTASSSLSYLLCSDPKCGTSDCASKNDKQVCPFKMGYLAGPAVSGSMVYENLQIDDVTIPHVAMGCTNETIQAGFVGLGRGPLSLISQAKDILDSAYSYCLLSEDDSHLSYLYLGRDAVPVSYTPVVRQTSYYEVKIDALHIGAQAIPSIAEPQPWGPLFDSGSSMTYLPPAVMDAIWNAFYSQVKLPRVDVTGVGACFDVTGISNEQFEASVPNVIFTLGGGQAFNPPKKNLFVVPRAGVKCLGFLAAPKGYPTILGSFLQQGFHIQNDLKNSRMGFAYTGCRQ